MQDQWDGVVLPQNYLMFKYKNIMYNVCPKLNVLVFLCSLSSDMYWLLKLGYARSFVFFLCNYLVVPQLYLLISIYVVEWQPNSMAIRVTVL